MKIKINNAIRNRAGSRQGKSFWKKITAMRVEAKRQGKGRKDGLRR